MWQCAAPLCAKIICRGEQRLHRNGLTACSTACAREIDRLVALEAR